MGQSVKMKQNAKRTEGCWWIEIAGEYSGGCKTEGVRGVQPISHHLGK